MRSSKVIIPVVIAALTAMALIGATSASATGTKLCTTHSGLPCTTGATSVHLTLKSGTVGKLLSPISVLCLGFLVEASVLALGNPQASHVTSQAFTGCGTGSAHNNCTATAEGQPLTNVLKTGLDEGVLTAVSGSTRLVCSNLGINCLYDLEGTELAAGANHVTAENTPTTELGGKFFCPDEGFLDGLLETLTNIYVLGDPEPSNSTALCKAHNNTTCAEKDRVKSLHMVTTKPPVLYNTIANVECESSLSTATVLALGKTQKLDAELTWQGCHTQGAADNCTLTTKGLPTLDLKRTALNLGEATALGLKIEVDCTVLGLIELDCVYGGDVTFGVEGALHKEGVGHGRFTVSKLVLENLEGTEHCPELVKWDASYEPLEHVYIVE